MHRTVEELMLALGLLTQEEHVRLREIAKVLLHKTRSNIWTDPRDLVADAAESTFRGAVGGCGGRRWRCDVHFIAHLAMTMKGLVSDAGKDGYLVRAAPLVVVTDGGSSHASPSAQEEVLEEESEVVLRAFLRRLLERFQNRGDGKVCWLINGRLEELPAPTIRELSGMTEMEYAAAQRRLSRALSEMKEEGEA